ncbi:MAG: hypothetical protein C0501_11015 [Isosphaera sp.]|nr:hypothetical protein [Isosphaera sp.]
MKLSAPPPPPPEPNEPTPALPPEGRTVPAAPTDKPLTWPAWFAGADFTLAVLALVFVFLLASFAARNSDVWLHLAAGQRLLAGEYTPGTDPFSYSAADRTWVNHSLLYDAASYLLYDAAGGAGLVVAKALAAALAFGLLLAIRRPGFPLWPWAAVAAVGAVAAAPYLTLRPVVGSILLLALTLFLLFRMPHRPGSWRFPAAIGVTFWVWAMTDEWFFVGPLALGLVLLGEVIQGPRADRDPDPLGPVPDVPTLAKALGVGVVACMLTPHHVRVWELPFELVGGSKELLADGRFRVAVAGPLGELYRNNAAFGYNANGLAFAALFLGGSAVLGLAAARLRFAHVALWVGFALLSLGSIQAIPFLAVVAVPVVAGPLNGLSAGLVLREWTDPRSRMLLLGSAGGRVAVLLAVAVGCALAWPGWVHPPAQNPAYARRVAWAVEPDPAAVRAAEQLQAWRASGKLPAEVRGLVASADLANYLAWFAPAEKVYANARYNHHRPELPGLVAARTGLRLVKADEGAEPGALPRVLLEAGAEYVAVYTGANEPQAFGSALSHAADEAHWSLWYFDGRVGVSGWREKPGAGKGTFDALRLDPVVLAFGPNVEPVPPGVAKPPTPRGFWDAFARAPDPPPPAADEARGWVGYAAVRQEVQAARQRAVLFAAQLVDRVTFPWPNRRVAVVSNFAPPLPPEDGQRAAPLLALRAARRAIAAAPDHPDGYVALDLALQDRFLPLSEAERWLGRVTALRQCLARLPDPADFRPGVYTASPTQVAIALADLYCGWRADAGGFPTGILAADVGRDKDGKWRGELAAFPTGVPVSVPGLEVLQLVGAAQAVGVVDGGKRVVRGPALDNSIPPQARVPGGPFLLPLDLAREAVQRAEAYAAVEWNQSDEANRERERIRAGLRRVEAELGRASAAFEGRKGAAKHPGQVVRLALQYQLPGEALRLLTDKDLDPDKDLGPEGPLLVLCRVAAELAVGRLEEAAADLDALTADAGAQRRLADPGLRVIVRQLAYQKLLLEGNYADAGKALEELDGEALRADPLKPVREKFDPKPFLEKQVLPDWAALAPRAGLLSPLPTDTVGGPLAWAARVANVTSFQGLRGNLARKRAEQVDFFTRRGILHLLEGNVSEAADRFLQTRPDALSAEERKEFERWGVVLGRAPGAELYLRLIEDARKRADSK